MSNTQDQILTKLWKFRQYFVNLGFTLGLTMVFLSGSAAVINMQRLNEINTLNIQMHIILHCIEKIATEIEFNIAAYRGYVLTGQDKFVEPLAASRQRIDENLFGIGQLITDPQLSEKLSALKSLIARRIQMCDEKIQLRREQGLEATALAVGTGQGEFLNQQIRAEMDDFIQSQKKLVEQSQADAYFYQNLAQLAYWLSLISGLTLLFLGMVGLRRQYRKRIRAEDQRNAAEAELRLYQNQLESMVKSRTLELESVNQELEAFAYSVSHDLRAPLRSIDGFSQALLEDFQDKLGGDGLDYLTRVRTASQRMGSLIDDLLSLSRITRKTLNCVAVDLSHIARKVLHDLQESMPQHRVETIVHSELYAIGDPGLFKIMLENLLGNAWKYSAKQEKPQIEFGSLQQNDQTVFFVRDNGVGFDMQYVNKLFGAFQRLHHRDEFEGSGIGLATVKRVIHRHGGNIWAESIPGRTTFYFTFSNLCCVDQKAESVFKLRNSA